MCSEILCYLSKDACSVGVLDAQKAPGQGSAEQPGQELFIKVEKTSKQKALGQFGFCDFIPTDTLGILSSGLGLNTIKWVFSQLPGLLQECQRRGTCDTLAMSGFISDGELSQEPYKDILKCVGHS